MDRHGIVELAIVFINIYDALFRSQYNDDT